MEAIIAISFSTSSCISFIYFWITFIEVASVEEKTLAPSIVQLFLPPVLFSFSYAMRLCFGIQSIIVNFSLWIIFTLIFFTCLKV